MKYKIEIKGMHCSGCQNLIAMSLEDAGFSDVQVDQEKNIGDFSSDKSESEVKETLDKAFAELAASNYSYTNLTLAA